MSYATDLRKKTGWSIKDDSAGGAGLVVDPRRRSGRSTVFLHEQDGLFIVTIKPPPWACKKPVTEYLDFRSALEAATAACLEYADSGGLLPLVSGEPR